MDARPVLVEIGRLLRDVRLEAVLIGNAAAALQGAPVTTVDFDFLFRKTARNLLKLKTLAARLRATVLRPYYPAADLYRVVRDDDGLQIDFMVTIHGIRSFEGLRDVPPRSRSTACRFSSPPLPTSSAASGWPGAPATWPSRHSGEVTCGKREAGTQGWPPSRKRVIARSGT